ncbi:hypothetical protein GCM10023075_27140 [Streptosporangium album]
MLPGRLVLPMSFRLQELFHALLHAGALAHQGAPVAGQVAQLPDGFGVDQAGPAHAALDDLGQPDRVQFVGLGAAGDVLDVLGVQRPAGEAFGFQQVVDGLPIFGGRFHRDQGDGLAAQPVGQGRQRGDQRGVLADFLAAPVGPFLVRDAHAHHQASLGDVDGGDAVDEFERFVGGVLHGVASFGSRGGWGWVVARGAGGGMD